WSALRPSPGPSPDPVAESNAEALVCGSVDPLNSRRGVRRGRPEPHGHRTVPAGRAGRRPERDGRRLPRGCRAGVAAVRRADRGPREHMSVTANYPGLPKASVRRIVGSVDLWITEITLDYGGDRYQAVSTLEMRD